MSSPDSPARHDLPAPHQALIAVVREIEDHMSKRGWDSPVAMFALVRTSAALATDPSLADVLDEQTKAAAQSDPHALTVIEQDALPPAVDVEDLLAQVSWPDTVDGVALSVERVTVPPAVEQQAHELVDDNARLAFIQHHPARQDVRIVVGVLRSGERWCAVRSRQRDMPQAVVDGADMVPELTDALAATLS